MSGFFYILQRLPYVLPWVLVQIAGIALALYFYRRNRVPALLVLCACSLQIFDSIVTTLVPIFFLRGGMGGVSSAFMWLSMLSVMTKSSSSCLLLAAVFIDRQPSHDGFEFSLPVNSLPVNSLPVNSLPVVTATVIETPKTTPSDRGIN